ncbi:hypothetical protein Leryth_010833 [Lithospermum erythrorhizon]|nr:hypothetical protein Leryth_010833 [Lithospermum erythrorhizon]
MSSTHRRRSGGGTSSFPPPPPSNLFPSSKSDLFQLLAVVATASAVAYSFNIIFAYYNKLPKPFCHSNVDFDFFITDDCEPCPSYGVCHDGKLECVSGYRKHGKQCVEDGEINEAAMRLTKLVEANLCEAYAQHLCGGPSVVWASENEVWNLLDQMEKYGLDESSFNYAKERAIGSIGSTMETRIDDKRLKGFKCPESLVEHYKQFSCQVQQYITEHALLLISVCALFGGCMLILLKVLRSYYLSVKAEELYGKVCNILEEISRSIGGEGEPWVVASWLRDHLLSPKERKDPLLWKKVEELIQEDTRVDRYPRLVKGESKVVWEWQGVVISTNFSVDQVL